MRSDDLYLVDLIEAAEGIDRILGDYDFETFARNDALRSAVLWKLYIISEASTKLSAGSRAHLEDIAWVEIRGFRNRLAHGYFTLAWDRVWEVAKHNAPLLRNHAEEILAREFPDVLRRLLERRFREAEPTEE